MSDPRIQLLPRETGGSLYLHRPSSADRLFDTVAGPYLSAISLSHLPGIDVEALAHLLRKNTARMIVRVSINEISQRPDDISEVIRFLPYERIDPLTDDPIQKQRSRVDLALACHPLYHGPTALVEHARTVFSEIVDSIFRYALCSMMRIVISGCFPSFPGWMAITIRDREKRPGKRVAVGLVHHDGARFHAFVNEGDQVSSSAASAYRFHSQTSHALLIHTHLLAPVLLDRETEHLKCINSEPRTPSFGEDLAKLFGNGSRWVLRRGEGVWCVGNTAYEAAESVLSCQDCALDSIAHLSSHPR